MPKLIAENKEANNLIVKNVNVLNNVLVKEKEIVVKEYTIQSGTIVFNNSKKVNVQFQRPFNKTPRVSLTLNDTSVSNPYVTSITKNGFTINFQNNWSGEIDWIAIERE